MQCSMFNVILAEYFSSLKIVTVPCMNTLKDIHTTHSDLNLQPFTCSNRNCSKNHYPALCERVLTATKIIITFVN